MMEGNGTTVIPSQLQEFNDLPTVTSRIVSSDTIQKVKKALTHNTNGSNIGSDSETDEVTPCQLEEIALNAKPDENSFLCDENEGSNVAEKQPSIAQALLDEIDNSSAKETLELKSAKKGGTLTKMFRNIRKKNDSGNVTSEDRHFESISGTSTMSLGKLIQKVNPVGKTNRESMSKVLHRIGDAFQRVTLNSNEDNADNSESNRRTFGRLIQFNHVSRSKSSSNTDQKEKSKSGSNVSGNYRDSEKLNDEKNNSV